MKLLLTALLLLPSLSVANEPKQTVDISVTENGFEPSAVNVKPNTIVTLNVTRKTDSTCAREIQVPTQKIKKELPLNKVVAIELGKLKKGEIRFGCGMDMMVGGQIHVK
jgi:plastocyanin domain-containing protein